MLNKYLITYSNNEYTNGFSGEVVEAATAKHAIHYYWVEMSDKESMIEEGTIDNIDTFGIEFNETNDSARICYDETSAVAIKLN